MTLFWAFMLLLAGFVILVKGADFFVDGASSIAKFFKISSLIIGLTVVAFGTSLPEAAVSITSALSGADDVSFGNIIGSNIFNLAFILGLASLVLPQVVHDDLIRRDFPFALIAVVLLVPMYYFFAGTSPYFILRFEAAILLFILASFMFFILKDAKAMNELNTQVVTHADEVEKVAKYSIKMAIPITLIGMAGIVGGGIMVTNGARTIALELGMSEWLVGLTIVSVGTSLPELVTSVVAAAKKESEISMGNIIGSNIFNIAFILGASAFINPIALNQTAIIDIYILIGLTAAVFLFSLSNRKISRLEGFFLVMSYISYLTYIILRDSPQA
ncbi:MAG: calcium/sodium antiporter [Acholeplasma sp.]|nr:calcium/sodium antiporter [Acholeplasma sp.]